MEGKSNESEKGKKPEKHEEASENVNSKNNLNDKLSRIQASLQTFISENEFKRFKDNVNENFNEMKEENESKVKELKEEIGELDRKNTKKAEKINEL